MEHEQVKKYLKDGYERHGFEVISEPPDGEAQIRYPAPETADVTLKISHDDIDAFGKLLAVHGEFTAIGNTGMANVNYRESLLKPLDPAISLQDIKDLEFRRGQSQTHVKIDHVSPVFVNYFRFEPGYMALCLDRLFNVPRRLRQQSATEPIDARQIFAQPLSVRVYDIDASTVEEAIELSDELIDGALFTLSYQTGIPLMLADSYPASRYDTLRRVKASTLTTNKLILPESEFRRDLVRLYQAGLASSIASQQFLSFYQILEFFFQDVTHAGVYNALEALLDAGDFEPDDRNLARIVALVEANQQNSDPVNLLDVLIHRHVDADAIKQFIEAAGGMAEETIHTMAARLVATRDAIVDAGKTGLPPADASIDHEIPLVRFLAEQVILSTVD